jgi:hypothetical protein
MNSLLLQGEQQLISCFLLIACLIYIYYSEDGCNTFYRNVSVFLQNYTVSDPRRWQKLLPSQQGLSSTELVRDGVDKWTKRNESFLRYTPLYFCSLCRFPNEAYDSESRKLIFFINLIFSVTKNREYKFYFRLQNRLFFTWVWACIHKKRGKRICSFQTVIILLQSSELVL